MEDTLSYIAILHPDTDGSIGVTFPDLPGCVTQADRGQDVLALAKEALLFHLEGMAQDGDEFPEPTHLHDIADNGQTMIYVTVPDPRARERFNVMAAAADLARIDAAAKKTGMTRSAYMVSRSVASAETDIRGGAYNFAETKVAAKKKKPVVGRKRRTK